MQGPGVEEAGESHSLYSYRESLVGTLEAPRGVRQMNGVPQSGADRSATAESRVRVYCSNLFTVVDRVCNRKSTLLFCANRSCKICKG